MWWSFTSAEVIINSINEMECWCVAHYNNKKKTLIWKYSNDTTMLLLVVSQPEILQKKSVLDLLNESLYSFANTPH